MPKNEKLDRASQENIRNILDNRGREDVKLQFPLKICTKNGRNFILQLLDKLEIEYSDRLFIEPGQQERVFSSAIESLKVEGEIVNKNLQKFIERVRKKMRIVAQKRAELTSIYEGILPTSKMQFMIGKEVKALHDLAQSTSSEKKIASFSEVYDMRGAVRAILNSLDGILGEKAKLIRGNPFALGSFLTDIAWTFKGLKQGMEDQLIEREIIEDLVLKGSGNPSQETLEKIEDLLEYNRLAGFEDWKEKTEEALLSWKESLEKTLGIQKED